MQISFGLILELMVLVLLATTVGYCFILNKKLQNLRADEQLLRQTIRELCVSIDTAERAVEHMRKTAIEREQALKLLIEAADASALKLRAAQGDAHETLSLIQQQTNFSLEIVQRLKSHTQPDQRQPIALDLAPEYLSINAGIEFPDVSSQPQMQRRPFSSISLFGRDSE